jgi:predicted nucleic acid-binding protein
MIVLDTNVLSEEMKPAPEPAVHGGYRDRTRWIYSQRQ